MFTEDIPHALSFPRSANTTTSSAAPRSLWRRWKTASEARWYAPQCAVTLVWWVDGGWLQGPRARVSSRLRSVVVAMLHVSVVPVSYSRSYSLMLPRARVRGRSRPIICSACACGCTSTRRRATPPPCRLCLRARRPSSTCVTRSLAYTLVLSRIYARVFIGFACVCLIYFALPVPPTQLTSNNLCMLLIEQPRTSRAREQRSCTG